jgi:hypothetical protein
MALRNANPERFTMKVRMTLLRTALVGAAILGVAAGFLPAWAPVPVGTPTAHVVASAQPGDGIVPVGTPTAH